MAKKKKKQFIDKKKSHHFYLMHRSQQDPLYHLDASEGGSKYILHPANQRTAEALSKQQNHQFSATQPFQEYVQNYAPQPTPELREVDEYGLPLDGYDYHQHLVPVSDHGTFISRQGKLLSISQSNSNSNSTLNLPPETLASKEDQEMQRMLESITLRPETMDPEVRALLEMDEDEGVLRVENEENEDLLLNDDFMAQLIKQEKGNDEKEDEVEFDFDQHVARLMEAAEAEEDGDVSDGEDLDLGVDVRRPMRDIDEHFDKLLESQYADEDIGELEEPEEDPTIAGDLDASSEQVSKVLHAHMEQLKIDDGSENKVMSGSLQIDKDDVLNFPPSDPEVDGEIQPLTMEDILSQSGYTMKEKPRWDCETILSTYSTLDNHPHLIKRKPKSSKIKSVKEAYVKSRERKDSSETEPDHAYEHYQLKVDTSIPRCKRETPEEKRMRKQMVKEQKRLRRQQKKESSQAFKQERLLQIKVEQKLKLSAAPPEGVSTFKL